jgi:hypothetical protein
VPDLFAGLVDDASVYPPGSAPLHQAVKDHRRHRAAWYAAMVGPLLVPASATAQLSELLGPGEDLVVGLIADSGLAGLRAALPQAPANVAHVEIAVAKRGEDPLPGLTALLDLLREVPGLAGYAEIPLTFGLVSALDTLSDAVAEGLPVAAKFRTGGLAAELFPTPIELAAVICACRDRDLPFKVAAGLRHAMRHTDPETGFTHHGFLNVLAGAAVAVDGGDVAEVAEVLAATHPVPLVEPARSRREESRPLWVGFGTVSVLDALTELIRLGLINGGFE